VGKKGGKRKRKKISTILFLFLIPLRGGAMLRYPPTALYEPPRSLRHRTGEMLASLSPPPAVFQAKLPW